MKTSSLSRHIRPLAFLLSLLILASVFTAPAFAASEFRYSSPEEAKYLALDCLMRCGFSSEYNPDGSLDSSRDLVRWTNTIKLYVGGQPTTEDMKQLDDFIMEIATHCPNVPNIRRVSDPGSANITLYYCPLDEMGNYVSNYVENNWGFFYFWYNGSGSIYKAELAIASDVNSPESKVHLMKEELVGALGLSNDHYQYSDSILYGEWTTTQELSDLDWLMLNMYYDPELPLFAGASHAYNLLEAKIRQ